MVQDPKQIAAFVGAGIGTLLGVPLLMDWLDPWLWKVSNQQYPNMGELVYWLIHGGIYVLAWSILQSTLYLGISAAIAAVTLRVAPLLTGYAH